MASTEAKQAPWAQATCVPDHLDGQVTAESVPRLCSHGLALPHQSQMRLQKSDMTSAVSVTFLWLKAVSRSAAGGLSDG